MTGSATAPMLLDCLLSSRPPAYALLYRPLTAGPATVEVLIGQASSVNSLASIPLPDLAGSVPGPRHDVLAVIPYRQITERGFSCVDDRSPLIALTISQQASLPLADLLDRIPGNPAGLSGGQFDIDDERYADTVRRILADEIGTGEGANFVIKRSFVADISDYSPRSALVLFSRLLTSEVGVYWTFIVHTGTRTFVGATPERHVSLHDGIAVMNPISGTYRYPASGPTLRGVMDFLNDQKEIDELFMVVDEELKMMAKVCEGGGQIIGPNLKEMARLAHTEYLIQGRSTLDPRTILRETMLAPTVTGSPLESACRVISRYEPEGRGYYSGVIALIGRDEAGQRSLDSAILIRTADIDAAGRLRVSVGSTLVRHSDPVAEVAETRAKAAGLISAFRSAPAAQTPRQAEGTVSGRFGTRPEICAALRERNVALAEFWQVPQAARVMPEPGLTGRDVLVIDAEDTFTTMLAHQLRALGLIATVRRYDEPYVLDGNDVVVLGPGPGDPRDWSDPRIARLRSAVRTLLDERRPLIAVCLSHQLLSLELGLTLIRRDTPNQGLQREIDLFGERERVGFYNSFAACSGSDGLDCGRWGRVEACRDPQTGEVHALRGLGFASMQFHPESVLTRDGPRIIARLMCGVFQEAPSAMKGSAMKG
jgi:2-amino-4-deoxychorismate synthase